MLVVRSCTRLAHDGEVKTGERISYFYTLSIMLNLWVFFCTEPSSVVVECSLVPRLPDLFNPREKLGTRLFERALAHR